MADWNSGRDAAYIKPKLVPSYNLLGRDDSGGPDWQPRTATFGDGGYAVGEEDKGHLSAEEGGNSPLEGSEQVSTLERRSRSRPKAGPKSDSSEARK